MSSDYEFSDDDGDYYDDEDMIDGTQDDGEHTSHWPLSALELTPLRGSRRRYGHGRIQRGL